LLTVRYSLITLTGLKLGLQVSVLADTDLEIYVDQSIHYLNKPVFQSNNKWRLRTSGYLQTYYASQAAKYPAEHSLTKLAHEVLYKSRPDNTARQKVEADLDSLFSSLRSRLADAVADESADVYTNLPQEEKTALASELVRRGRDVSELSVLKENGQFVHFLRPQGIVAIFRYNPKLFFDGKVWSITYADIPKIDQLEENAFKLKSGMSMEVFWRLRLFMLPRAPIIQGVRACKSGLQAFVGQTGGLI